MTLADQVLIYDTFMEVILKVRTGQQKLSHSVEDATSIIPLCDNTIGTEPSWVQETSVAGAIARWIERFTL